jgi:hypothetical protein
MVYLHKFTLISNFALPFSKLLISEFLFGMLKTLHCSAPAPHVKIVLLLNVYQLLMLSAGMMTYLQPGTAFSII